MAAERSTSQNGTSQSLSSDTDLDLPEILAFTITLAKSAGSMLMSALDSRRLGVTPEHSATVKDNAVDIVTKTDTAVESFIQQSIATAYPTHRFIGEESAYSDTKYLGVKNKPYLVTDDPTWIVDPLDGTVNFTHAFPMFCVSIALCVRQEPIVGVVFAPLLGQLFSARKGGGAWLNESVRLPYLGREVGLLPRGAPGRCVFGVEWGKDRRWTGETQKMGTMRRKVESFVNMAAQPETRGAGLGGMVHGVRSLGSACLDLAYVAMGGIDLWWEGGCWEWDVAAGICLVEEAGGLVTGANPPVDGQTCKVEKARLGGRLYLAVRPAFDVEGEVETGRQSQERAVREVWKRVHGLEYDRPCAFES